jgi:hypothetical protein
VNEYLKALPSGYDVFNYDADVKDFENGPYRQKEKLRKKFAFAIPTDAALRAILDIIYTLVGSSRWLLNRMRKEQ